MSIITMQNTVEAKWILVEDTFHGSSQASLAGDQKQADALHALAEEYAAEARKAQYDLDKAEAKLASEVMEECLELSTGWDEMPEWDEIPF